MKKRNRSIKTVKTLAFLLSSLLISSMDLSGQASQVDLLPPSPGTKELFQKNYLLGMEMDCLYSPFTLSKEVPTDYALGGAVNFEFYGQNRLFSRTTLPGTVIGFILAPYIYTIKDENKEHFKNIPMFTGGCFLGYQFYFPLTTDMILSPRIYGGLKYYIMWMRILSEDLSTTTDISRWNPIFLGGIDLNLIFKNRFNLSLAAEYDLLYEKADSRKGHSLHISLGAGMFF